MVQLGSGGWPRWRLATGGSGLVPRAEKRSGRWGTLLLLYSAEEHGRRDDEDGGRRG